MTHAGMNRRHRHRLPQRRGAIAVELEHAGHHFRMQIGCFPDGAGSKAWTVHAAQFSENRTPCVLQRRAVKIETIDLNWREDDRGLSLHLRQAKSPLLWVVADATYPGMWRIRLPDDRLSDMVNLARAKDAALSVALGALNPKKGYRESRPEAPPARSSGWSAVQPPNAAFNRPQAEIRAIED